MNISKPTLLLLLATALSGCSTIPPQAYYNRGDPENLLTTSTEVVNVSLTRPNALGQLTGLADSDPPSSVQLNCAQADALCLEAKGIFDHRKIPVNWGEQGDEVVLLYQRTTARDCENRYIDNSVNPYNLPPPTFGCSITANMVQMVSDKRQFTNPALMDFPDAEKGVRVYHNYLEPASSEEKGLGASVIQAGAK